MHALVFFTTIVTVLVTVTGLVSSNSIRYNTSNTNGVSNKANNIYSNSNSYSNGYRRSVGRRTTESHHTSRNYTCEQDKELELLVNTTNTKTKFYILSHDSHSRRIAEKFAYCKCWIEQFHLNSSKFFETSIYRDLFPVKNKAKEWEKLDYIGIATYKTVHRIQLHKGIYFTQDLAEIKNKLLVARDGNYEFIPFLRSTTELMDSILYWHGENFKVAWDTLLLKMGYSSATIRKYDTVRPFYRNIFIAKPAVLVKLSTLMVQAMELVEFDKDLAKLFEADAKYGYGQPEVALRVFGTKYYQLHPFIFERLPTFFLYEMGVSICSFKAGPCAYNY